MRLHSYINITGTHWTRQSSNDPNQQNFKKGLHFLFGPPEGYYWLYFDIVNIELRIWAYEVSSKPLIEAFERGESVHMIIARAIRPHQIERAGGEKQWKNSDHIHHQYTDTKAGTFTRIYGGGVVKANNTYGIPDACSIIDEKIPEVGAYFRKLEADMKNNALKYGYPSIFTTQGYRLEVPITKPYSVPSARIQGTASIIMQDMMVKIVETPIYNWGPLCCPDLNHIKPQFPYCNLIQQVHDSLTFEIPMHDTQDTTNDLIHAELEKVGREHIPTCPLEMKVILPTPDEELRYRLYNYLPEIINDYEVTYHYQEGYYIAECKYKESILEFKALSYQEVRQLTIDKLEEELPF